MKKKRGETGEQWTALPDGVRDRIRPQRKRFCRVGAQACSTIAHGHTLSVGGGQFLD